MQSESAGWRRNGLRGCAVALATAALCWPAFWIGYPLLCPDSVGYLRDGRRVALLLLGSHVVTSNHIRSALYALVLYLLHRETTPWPVILWSGLLVAWTIWLTMRSLRGPRPVAFYLALIVALCALTTVSWFVSIVLADILGAVAYLCLYLLVFAPETLKRWETVAVIAIAAWCITAHLTHVMVAVALCGFLGLLWLLRWQPIAHRGRPLLRASGVVLLAIVAMIAINARIFGMGRPSLSGPQPPYLMARILADGVAHDTLREACPQLQWTICQSVDRLPWSADQFLWYDGGIYASATPAQQAALKQEELPLIMLTLRKHPLRQLKRSWLNFTAQLTGAGVQDVKYDLPWMSVHAGDAVPAMLPHYLASSQREATLQPLFSHTLQETVTIFSLAAALVLLPLLWRRRHDAAAAGLLGLSAMVAFLLPANALFTGVLSGVFPRYQGRVEWLLPLLAGLMGYHCIAKARRRL